MDKDKAIIDSQGTGLILIQTPENKARPGQIPYAKRDLWRWTTQSLGSKAKSWLRTWFWELGGSHAESMWVPFLKTQFWYSLSVSWAHWLCIGDSSMLQWRAVLLSRLFKRTSLCGSFRPHLKIGIGCFPFHILTIPLCPKSHSWSFRAEVLQCCYKGRTNGLAQNFGINIKSL